MTRPVLNSLGRYVRTLAGSAAESSATDEQLLGRFVQGRDEAAFTALVQRHGTLVLQVAWRVLGDWHQAEEVFQAAFLTLARKAAAIRRQQALASWLYAVAYRLALRARARAARGEAGTAGPERVAAGDPLEALSAREFLTVLDEELQALAEKYRAPLVLCYLHEQTQEEAARQLGCPPGTLRSRLQRGKDLLRRRLERRGVTLSAAALAATLAAGAVQGAVPAALVAATVAAARRGPNVLGAGVSGRVLALLDGADRVIVISKVRILGAILLLLGLLAAGTVPQLVWTEPGAAQTPPGPPPGADQPRPALDAQGDPLQAGAVRRFGTLRFRHGDSVNALAYSRDGKQVASGGMDREVWVWDRATGKRLHRLVGHKAFFGFVGFSPDGTLLASSDVDNNILLWDLSTGKKRCQFPGAAFVFARDGKTLLTGGKFVASPRPCFQELAYAIDDNPIRRWDTATGREGKPLGRGAPFAFAADGRRLAAISGRRSELAGPERPKFQDQAVSVWDVITDRELQRQPIDKDETFDSGVFSPRGLCLSTRRGRNDVSVNVWLLPDGGKKLQPLPSFNDGSLRQLVFAADGRLGAPHFPTSRGVPVWDLATGKELTRLAGPVATTTLNTLAFSPDGKELVTGGTSALVFWDTANGREKPVAEGHKASVLMVGFAAGGDRLCSAGWDGTLRFWDRHTGQQVAQVDHPGGGYSYTTFLSPDRKLLACCNRETVGLWNAVTGARAGKLSLGKGDSFLAAAFSPDGKLLAAFGSRQGTVGVWDIASGKALWQTSSGRYVKFGGVLAFSPNGRLLASLGGDGVKIRLREAATGKVLGELNCDSPLNDGRHRCALAFSPDGRALAASNRRNVWLWEVATGKERLHIQAPGDLSSSLAFSPDGRWLAAGQGGVGGAGSLSGYAAPIHLWDVANGKETHRCTGHRINVQDVAFSPDGRSLVSGGTDTTILLWQLPDRLFAKKALTAATAEQLAAWWQELAGADAMRAYQVQRRLAATTRAAAFLKEHVRPAAAPDAKLVAQLIDDLGSDSFKVRQQAQKKLSDLGDLVEPTLRAALKKPLTLEAHQRIMELLDRALVPAGKELQALRALEVLEWTATPEAQAVVARLTQGLPGTRLTTEAQATLRRLTAKH
jgi:RNA polymerase sigma factor (sigma-70 family)